jgi:hypothetical protein
LVNISIWAKTWNNYDRRCLPSLCHSDPSGKWRELFARSTFKNGKSPKNIEECVPYVMRLTRADGSVLNLPDTFPDPTPLPKSEVAVHVDGVIVHAKIEKHSTWHALSPEIGLQPVDMVTATQIGRECPAAAETSLGDE